MALRSRSGRYIHMTDLVDQMFPPIHKRFVQEYTDTNFWKAPIGDFTLPDFTPPSPALSARSDTSNQSALARLRSGFSLGGGKAAQRATPEPKPDILSKMERSTSLGMDEDERGDWRGVKRGGPRARSVDSMPGSLPGSEDDTMWEDDEEGEVDEEEYAEEGEEQEPMLETDEAFDEDVLAAGEMASVPFL
jgi:phosphatidate phosphatase LPIN